MAPVLAGLRARSDEADLRLVLTGQHTTLVDQALETFQLVPDYSLDIMTEGQSLYDVAHGCLDGLREVIRDFGHMRCWCKATQRRSALEPWSATSSGYWLVTSKLDLDPTINGHRFRRKSSDASPTWYRIGTSYPPSEQRTASVPKACPPSASM